MGIQQPTAQSIARQAQQIQQTPQTLQNTLPVTPPAKRTREEICQSLARDLLDYLDRMAPPRGEEAGVYTYDDLARLLGRSRSTVSRWARQGQFGALVTLGRSVRVTQQGLDQFLLAANRPANPPANPQVDLPGGPWGMGY